MKNIIYTLIIGIIFIGNISFGDTGDSSTMITLDKIDILICSFFFLGSLIAFGVGGAHEWHLTIQDLRIEEGEIQNKQRHQLLAGFKDRAAVWAGILGTLIAMITTQVERFSQSISFSTIISSLLILIGPYLLGRLIYIFYLHGSEYRKTKTVASKNYLPFFFMNISILTVIVNYYSLMEFTYMLEGCVTSQSSMYLYYNLASKLLTALLVPCLIDQTVMVINFIKKIDRCPDKFARISPPLSRMLGYSEIVENSERIANQIDKDGKIRFGSSEDIELIIGQ